MVKYKNLEDLRDMMDSSVIDPPERFIVGRNQGHCKV